MYDGLVPSSIVEQKRICRGVASTKAEAKTDTVTTFNLSALKKQ